MSVVFKSNIGIEENGAWYIELHDMQDGRRKKCFSIEEYSESIEDFGKNYGGKIDEVEWSKDENVHPYVMNEIRLLMMKEEESIENAKEEN